MDELASVVIASLLAALLAGLSTFLATRIGIEHRLTKLETRFDRLRPLERFLDTHGERGMYSWLQGRDDE